MMSDDNKIKVLFICVRNSGRSQIAEAYLKKIGSERFEVESAGYKPEAINPLVLKVMEEDGFDLSGNKPQSAWDLFKEGKLFQYIITVCDRAHEEECPLFPKPFVQLHWPYPDPETFTGTDSEKLEQTRELRDAIKERIEKFVADIDNS
ncbi:arsenate reductase ArsC [Methanolobus bombayensis]|uniref:arsenate reductase ArsC n=1 Tax=Methanolobus bombayensis TaxID=38023 RepID=UPI001AE5598C|nr:arsenate reductase ArsC [Methanolobus bombayensis]MBP1909280.1 arsenate reductase [Methanolobus bombayensis]